MSIVLESYRKLIRRPPDHPLGYVVAISGALMQMMSYGIDNSFSIFSRSMQEDPTLNFPSATAVSYGNSVSLGLSPVFGVLAGFLVDRVPPRVMMFISTALLFLGLWLSSACAHSSIAVTFSYCLLASISSACMLSPGAAATSSWFDKRVGLAQGINFSGGGIGSAFIPAVLGSWVESYGWRKTFRLMSGFCAIGLLGTLLSCRRAHPREAARETAEDAEANGAAHDESAKDGFLPDDLAREGGEHSPAKSSGEAELELSTSNSSEDQRELQMTPHDRLMEAVHTRRLTILETLQVFLTKEFLANFFMFAIYSWAFYGLIYVTVPYVSSMGQANTVYANVKPISTSKASTVFTFWGVFQIVGSILIGALASFTMDAFAYSACCAVGGMACAVLVFCRGYVAFVICLIIVGFCTAGAFAVMPALIAKTLHGPSLGFFMGCVFVAGCVGGFSSPPIQAQLATRHNGNYSYGCIVISCCFTVPGIICYIFLWPHKQNTIAKIVRQVRLGKKRRSLDNVEPQ